MNGRQIRWGYLLAGGLAVAIVVAMVAGVVLPVRAESIPTQTAVATSARRKVSAAGRVASMRDTLVFASVQGTVERVLIANQRKVRKGDILVVLDAEPYRVEMAQALAQMQQARATLDSQGTLSGTAAEKTAARSALASAKRTYAFAKRSARRTVIRAPHSGTVFLLSSSTGQASPRIERGQGVSPQAPLLRLIDLDKLKFVADVDQRDVSLVAKGQLARCSLDSSADLTYEGAVTHVSLISKTTPSGVTAFTAESSFPSAAKGPRPGTEGTVEIAVGGTSTAVAVPQAAVTRRDGQPVVFVVVGGHAHARLVSLGPSRGGEYQVTSGLKAGDVVATSGVNGLSEGARVGAR